MREITQEILNPLSIGSKSVKAFLMSKIKMRQQIICNHDYRRLDCLHMNICVEVILLNKWLANTVQEKG